MRFEFHKMLLLSLLAVAFVGRSESTTIMCHQCSDCPDASKLGEPKACKDVGYFDILENLATKTVTDAGERDKLIHGLKIAKGLNPPAGACYKMAAEIGGKELAYRGCAPQGLPEVCSPPGKMISCICKGDGCNSAPSFAFASSLLVACIASVAILLFNA